MATPVIRSTPPASESHTPRVRHRSLWTEFTPWFMTTVSVLVLVCLAWFLLNNIYWFRKSAADSASWTQDTYRIYIYQLLLAMIKRSVGLFAGFALIFIGTSVAFYTLKHDIGFDGSAGGMSAKLNTASPGIIAMVLGVALIMFTIQSKDSMTYSSTESEPKMATTGPSQDSTGGTPPKLRSLVPQGDTVTSLTGPGKKKAYNKEPGKDPDQKTKALKSLVPADEEQ